MCALRLWTSLQLLCASSTFRSAHCYHRALLRALGRGLEVLLLVSTIIRQHDSMHWIDSSFSKSAPLCDQWPQPHSQHPPSFYSHCVSRNCHHIHPGKCWEMAFSSRFPSSWKGVEMILPVPHTWRTSPKFNLPRFQPPFACLPILTQSNL